MKKSLPLGLLALAASVALFSGCDQESYSDQVRYGLRTDPLYIKEDLKEERIEPDVPGVFPINSPKDLLDIRNPLYAENKNRDLFKAGVFLDPTLVPREDRKEIDAMLVWMFGTPAAPKVVSLDDRTKKDLEDMKLDGPTLRQGSALYRIHCVHCHGVPGNGRGPTAKWINPHPRDFRLGKYKFQSVDQAREELPPSREDLRRTLHQGIEGTAMPSFLILKEADLEALVSYVIHLSMRGKLEFDTINLSYTYNSKDNTLTKSEDREDFETFMQEHFKNKILEKWVKAQNNRIKVEPYPYTDDQLQASVERGKELFNDPKNAKCVTCHVNYGRDAKFRYDGWATLVRPNNLTLGIYRGGRRPVDIYYRIHSGIAPAGMPKFVGTLKNEQIWDLVNFVQAVGNPTMRKKIGFSLD